MPDATDPKSAPSAAAPAPQKPAAAAPAAAKPVEKAILSELREPVDRVLVRSYPKTVFLYPTALAALLCGIMTAVGAGEPRHLGFIFLTVLFFNLVVISFEFTRHISVALVLGIFVIVLAGMLLNERLHIVEFLRALYSRIDWQANRGFYFAVVGIYVFLMIGVLIDTRMDYWEVRGNEILHHHGFLGDVERFPAPQIKFKKEITDVFEYFLLASGRLVIHPSPSDRPVVLENVPRINRIEDEIEDMLDSMRVRIETGSR
jgi:hypothetical protein